MLNDSFKNNSPSYIWKKKYEERLKETFPAPLIDFQGLPNYDLDVNAIRDYVNQVSQRIEQGVQTLTSSFTKAADTIDDFLWYRMKQEYNIQQQQIHQREDTPILFVSNEYKTKESPLSTFGYHLTLPYTKQHRWNEDLRFHIEGELLLGNLRESNENRQSNPQVDISSLMDGEISNGILLESFFVEEYHQALPYQFRYEEGVSMITHSSQPSAWITIEPKIPRSMNLFHLLAGHRSLPATIHEIELTDEYDTIHRMSPQQDLSSYSFTTESYNIKRIRIHVSQPNPRPTLLDVWGYETKRGQLIPGQMPSLQGIGYEFHSYRQKPLGVVQESGQDLDVSSVLSAPESTAKEFTLPALKYEIQLQDIACMMVDFEPIGQWISPVIDVPSDTKGMWLDSSVMIPDSFEDGDWIQLFVSIDNGSTWHPIQSHSISGTYNQVRFNPPRGFKQDGVLVSNSNHVRFKVELQRPSGVNLSPIVYNLIPHFF